MGQIEFEDPANEISCKFSLIPSPKTAAICEGTFKKIDCNIKSITDIRNRDLTYFDANRILRNPDGSIKIELFEDG